MGTGQTCTKTLFCEELSMHDETLLHEGLCLHESTKTIKNKQENKNK